MSGRLDVIQVIRRVFEIYVDQAPVLMPAAAVVFVITGIVSALLVAASPGLALLALLISLIATTLFTGMVVELVADVQDGRRDARAGQLLRAVTPVIGQLILVGLVYAVGVVIGFVLLIIPGLILLTVWAVFAPVIVLERPPGLKALGRSRELVRGSGWQVFGVILVLFVGVGVIASAIELAAESAGTGVGIVARVIAGVLTAPISSLAAAVLYFELGGRPAAAAAGWGQSGPDPDPDPDPGPDPGPDPPAPTGGDPDGASDAFGRPPADGEPAGGSGPRPDVGL